MARKILLADDSVTAQNMGRKILVDAGYDVVTVNNGSAALKRISEAKPDLIVLDVYMPGYSGLEVCQRLKEAPDTSHIPILLTVGKLEPFKPEEARRARADAHIVKPFEASELLSALARLEDRMVPSANEPRFSTTVIGVERFGSERDSSKMEPNDPDTGWKSRLRFPSKKKKQEAEQEPEEVPASFHDFRKGRGKSAGNGSPAGPAPIAQEPGLVPDIPRDITPEELDALSALAAKLDGPIPEAEKIASLAEQVGPGAEDEAASSSATESKADAKAAERAAEPTKEFEVSAAPGESVAHAVAANNEISVPVAPVVKPAEVAAAAQTTAEISQSEALKAESPQAPASHNPYVAAVNNALQAEQAAPVDRQDEPIFAAEQKIEAKAEIAAEEPVEVKDAVSEPAPIEAVPAKADALKDQRAAAPAATIEHSVTAELKVEESAEPQIEKAEVEATKVEASTIEVAKVEESKTEAEQSGSAQSAPAVARPHPDAAAMIQAEATAPSDEELAEALRLLTPTAGDGEASMPSHETPVAPGQLLAEEVARTAAGGTRWIAQAVALTPEEASMSLEAEMFRTFAQAPAALAAAAGASGEIESAPVSQTAPVPETLEKRLADKSDVVSSEKLAMEPVAGPEPTADASLEPATRDQAMEKVASEGTAVELRGNRLPEEVVEEEPPATFADVAMPQLEATPVVQAEPEKPASALKGAARDEDQKSSSDGGGDGDMGKEHKDNSGKSGWHQIRRPSSAAAADVVEAAKQAESTPEEAPKAMAAAAAESGAGADANAIASIVDSVLADLRPKIVEEIAKKLGKK